MIHLTSFVIPMAVLVPNLLFFRTQPRNLPDPEMTSPEPLVLTIFENIGRIGIFVLPIFSPLHLYGLWGIVGIIGMILAIGVYYFGWLRYFSNGREYQLLFSPYLGIPVPMAVSPIVYMFFAALVLRSLYVLIAAAILAIGHIPISLHAYRQIQT